MGNFCTHSKNNFGFNFFLRVIYHLVDTKGLKAVEKVERVREQIYIALEEYCRNSHPEEPGRFAKLLIRLPSLRSVGLKCLDYLFFFHMSSQTNIDQFLMEVLEAPVMDS